MGGGGLFRRKILGDGSSVLKGMLFRTSGLAKGTLPVIWSI